MTIAERVVTTAIIASSTSGFVSLTGGSHAIVQRAAIASTISEISRPIFYSIAEEYLDYRVLLFSGLLLCSLIRVVVLGQMLNFRNFARIGIGHISTVQALTYINR